MWLRLLEIIEEITACKESKLIFWLRESMRYGDVFLVRGNIILSCFIIEGERILPCVVKLAKIKWINYFLKITFDISNVLMFK